MTEKNIFQRVKTSYNLSRMSRSRIISVGCGGAASFLEDMARCGIGEFVLIDPDIVEEANIATQQAYIDDLGKPKVECIANRLKRVNPFARIYACQSSIENISDEGFSAIAINP